jgi:hypothetical protein
VAAVYRSSKGGGDKVWMRLVTRSLEGVCDYGNYKCQYYVQDKRKPATFKYTTLRSIATLTPVFPCVLNGAYDQLQGLVFIPTSGQTTVS